jgi:hypothetical protein
LPYSFETAYQDALEIVKDFEPDRALMAKEWLCRILTNNRNNPIQVWPLQGDNLISEYSLKCKWKRNSGAWNRTTKLICKRKPAQRSFVRPIYQNPKTKLVLCSCDAFNRITHALKRQCFNKLGTGFYRRMLLGGKHRYVWTLSHTDNPNLFWVATTIAPWGLSVADIPRPWSFPRGVINYADRQRVSGVPGLYIS